MLLRNLSLAALLLAAPASTVVPALAANNIVLVHGMNMDGSSWRPVYDILVDKGYKVSIVQ